LSSAIIKPASIAAHLCYEWLRYSLSLSSHTQETENAAILLS